MQARLIEFWLESRAPGARGPGRGDWFLSAVVAIAAVSEGIVDEDLTWRALSVAVALGIALVLPWRRTHPLHVVVFSFAATGLVHAAGIFATTRWLGLSTNVIMVLLPYALLRWASGREAMLGFAVMAVSFTIAMWDAGHSWGEILGASLFLLFPAALGASVRYRDSATRRAREQVRLREREQLARELHDTVAHHVSAIAVQAQAGRALADSRPEAAVEVLGVIEEAASRTLADMRRIVSALRTTGDEALAPSAGLVDIAQLGETVRGDVPVVVTLDDASMDLDTSLQTTLYRLAQEAVTNARRHARNASRIDVRVEANPGEVHLTVEDDGVPASLEGSGGFGLQGMSERVGLLGGTLQAGPGATRGWSVKAVLPRVVNPS